jgi:NAD(P)-dependent dehydrogenase (short-subunit alcohol dehydrogenase family)
VDIRNRTVVVTGAARGIGRDIAEAALYLTRAENVTGIALTVAGGTEMN